MKVRMSNLYRDIYKERIVYKKPTFIKLWNLYDDNIIAYFMKRFCSYLSEMGLSCHRMYPRGVTQVRNQQSTKTSYFYIIVFQDQHSHTQKKIEDRFLNFDFNHLLFFDIVDKEEGYKVLKEFNKILKTKNESNEILKINRTNPSFFLNPSFVLILYDSTNEMGHFQPPEFCSVSIPSYSHLIITEQKHFDVQGFYEWLYKITDRQSRSVERYI